MKRKILPFACTLFMTTPAWLRAEGEAAPGNEFDLMRLIVMLGIGALFFYVLLWRPEQKRRKAMEQQRSKLKKGDRVTAMGILGTIDKVEEHTAILKMVDGGKIEVLLAAISEVSSSEETKSEDE